jgi:hypothetical protein
MPCSAELNGKNFVSGQIMRLSTRAHRLLWKKATPNWQMLPWSLFAVSTSIDRKSITYTLKETYCLKLLLFL